MVAPDTQFERFLRHPEVRKDDVSAVLVPGREHQNERRDVRCGGEVEPAVADAPFQIVLGNGKGAGVPFLHRHPSDRLLHPLIEPQLTESVLLAGVLHGGLAGGFHLVDANRDAEGRVRLFPHFGVCPVLVLLRPVYHGVEGRIVFPPLLDVDGLLMHLIADGIGVIARRGDQKVQRLHPRVAGALEHDVEELPVRLRVQLVENNAVSVEAVLVRHIRRQNLVGTVGRFVDELLLRLQYLHALGQRRTEPHHVHRHVKYDLRLVAVGGAAVHLGTFLSVSAGEEKRDGGGKLRLALFFSYLDVRRIELAVSILLQNAEQVSDDLFLPVDKLKRLSRPGAFRVAQGLYEHDRVVGGVFVVTGGLRHEPRGGVFFQFPHSVLLSEKHKK